VSESPANTKPLRGPGLLGVVLGILLAAGSALFGVLAAALFLFASMGPSGAGSAWPLLLLVGGLLLGLLRFKLSFVMLAAPSAPRGLCMASIITSGACAALILTLAGGTPGALGWAVVGLLLLEVVLTTYIMLAEPRRVAKEKEAS
jgi:hypothetical protein